VDVNDVGEWVQADVHIGAELDVGALGLAAQLLERAAQVQHPDLGVDGPVGPGHLVHQHRLARARCADDREVVVAQVVVEDVQGHQLPTAPAEHQGGGACAAPLGDQGRKVDGVGHGLARDATHLGQIAMKAGRQGHGQAGQQRLAVHVHVGVELKAPATPDGVGRFVGRHRLARWREDGQLVVQADQAATGVDGLGGGGPVLQLLAHVRHHVGHLALGVLRGAHMVGGDRGLGGIGVEHMHAHGQQEGRAVLQGGLHQVADQRAHLPKGEALRKGLDGVKARLQFVRSGLLPQAQAAGGGILDGVEVDDLVAQFASVVVVQVWRVGLRDAVRVGEQRAPVDQVGGIADPVGQGGRTQRGGHGLALGHHLFAPGHVLGVTGQGDAEHQAEVPDRVVKARGQRGLGSPQQVAHALACQGVEEVVVAGRAPPMLGLICLVLVFDSQVGIAAQLATHMG